MTATKTIPELELVLKTGTPEEAAKEAIFLGFHPHGHEWIGVTKEVFDNLVTKTIFNWVSLEDWVELAGVLNLIGERAGRPQKDITPELAEMSCRWRFPKGVPDGGL